MKESGKPSVPEESPSSGDEPQSTVRDMVLDVFRFDRHRIFQALGLIVAASVAEGVGLALLLPILGFAIGTDDARDGANILGVELSFASAVGVAVTLFVCVALAAAYLSWRRSVVLSSILHDFIADLSKRSHAALLRSGPERVTGRRRTELMHLTTVDVARSGQGAHFLFSTAGQVLRIPALAVVAFAMSPGAALATVVILIGVTALARPFDHRARQTGSTLTDTGARMLGRADESIANIALIKTHKAEDRWIARYGAAVDARHAAQHDLATGQAAARAVATAGGAVGMALIVWIALVVLGTGLAETTVLVIALSRLLPTVVQLHASWRSMLSAVPSHARVTHLLARAATDREPPLPAAPVRAGGPVSLAFEGVSIARVPDAPPVLPDLTLDLVTGGLTLLMGRSGAGKSTLGLGLAGLLPVRGGRVLLDGEEVAGDGRLALRREAVLLAQDPALFNDTILGNLRLAAPRADRAAMREALDAAAADFVFGLPKGLDTTVGDRGATLSGGERQRIALAQALLAKPRLLVLDEATSALDAEAEDRVVSSLLRLRSRTTLVFITHRRALARHADTVVVLDDGRIVANGPWRDVRGEDDL